MCSKIVGLTAYFSASDATTSMLLCTGPMEGDVETANIALA